MKARSFEDATPVKKAKKVEVHTKAEKVEVPTKAVEKTEAPAPSVRRNGTSKNVQEVHRVLGKPGWSINIRILCEMDTTVSFIWKLWIETISIIFLRSLDLTTRSAYQNSHVVILAASLEPVPQVGAVEPTRLNRCLPIYQGFFSGGGAQIKTARTQKCYWCGGSLAEQCYRVPDNKTLTKYQCRKCYKYPARRTFDPEIVAAREIADLAYEARQSWTKKTFCESCGFTSSDPRKLVFHPHIEMTICQREYDFHRRTGRLNPIGRLSRSPCSYQ